MAYTLKLDEGFVCPSIAALRTTPNDKNKTAFLILTSGVAGSTYDGRGGLFIFDKNNTSPDNGATVVRPTGTTTGAWVRLDHGQDSIHFEQNGALVAGTFTKLVTRGGIYGTINAILGTAGSTTTTVAIQVNGVTAATATFAAAATTATITYTSGSTFSAADVNKISFVVTAGTGAANLALSIDA